MTKLQADSLSSLIRMVLAALRRSSQDVFASA
jgi:hypothetical protein